MKTTVEISDGLLLQAKQYALERGLTLRQMIEDGLHTVLQRPAAPKAKFKLRDGSYPGGDPGPDLSWSEIRDIIYEGRGGNPR